MRIRLIAVAVAIGALGAGAAGHAANRPTIVATIPNSGIVGGMVFAASSLWAADAQHTTVIRIDPETNRILARIRIGKPLPYLDDQDQVDAWVAYGDGYVWATDQAHDRIVRIDPATNRVVAAVPVASPWDLTVSDGAVWVPQFEPYTLARIDESTNTITKRIPANGPSSVTAGAGSVWVVLHRADEILRIEPATGNVLATIPLRQATSPERAYFAFGSVWVSDGNETHSLFRIDPATNRVSARITPPGSFFQNTVVAGGRWLWDVSPSGDVYKIDPQTNHIVLRTRFHSPSVCGEPPAPKPCFFNGATYGDGSIWTYDSNKQAIIRITT